MNTSDLVKVCKEVSTLGSPCGTTVRGCIQKFPDWDDNEIYAYNNKQSLRSNTKGYGGKTHYTDL
jgi:hypothetical protein